MKELVLLKGNNYGLTITLDSEIQFDELLEKVEEKFTAAAGFFNSTKQIALKVEGRTLSSEEMTRLLESITKASSLAIAYVIEENQVIETQMKNLIKEKADKEEEERSEQSEQTEKPISSRDNGEHLGKFYKGTLRSGQNLESDSSVIVIGDVNPGATVSAKGNVVVLGCIKGNAFAGKDNNNEAFIAALDMDPIQIRIGSKIARSSDDKGTKKRKLRKRRKEQYSDEAKIAFVEEGNIYIEPISKALLNDILI
ncbi:MAG: septum site-determining protein MinC [Anaerostipes sp.]|jgi:septum site-determining protein MinC|nr:septum site-determining protein MinC [Anaerostipes sp.]